jgi:hypothetical protein
MIFQSAFPVNLVAAPAQINIPTGGTFGAAFVVRDASGAPVYLSISDNASQVFRSGVANGAAAVGFVFDSVNLLGNATAEVISLRAAGTEWGILKTYSGGNTGLVLSATGLADYMSIDGPLTGFQWVIGGTTRMYMDSAHFYPNAAMNLGDSVSGFGQVWAARYNGLSQSVAFSATPAFDPSSLGEVIHFGPVTANVTGATMAAGTRGARCTIVMLKDATANAYTVAFAGTNVRPQAGSMAFNAGASSLFTIPFRWDDKLATPAWVPDGAPSLAL